MGGLGLGLISVAPAGMSMHRTQHGQRGLQPFSSSRTPAAPARSVDCVVAAAQRTAFHIAEPPRCSELLLAHQVLHAARGSHSPRFRAPCVWPAGTPSPSARTFAFARKALSNLSQKASFDGGRFICRQLSSLSLAANNSRSRHSQFLPSRSVTPIVGPR